MWEAVAEAVDEFVREHHGFLSAEDMAGLEATLERPLALDYRGHTVFKTGPWGQGPVFLQQLALYRAGETEALASRAELPLSALAAGEGCHLFHGYGVN